MVSEIGLQDAVVQAKDLSTEELRSVFGAVILVNVAVAAVIAVLLAPLAATFFSEPRLREVMQVLSLQFLISSLIVIPTAMLERKLAYRGRSVGQVAATLIGSLTTLALAYSGAGVWALVGGSLSKALVEAVILNSISPFLELPAFAFSTVRHLIGYGLKVALTRLLWFVYSQADTFIIGKVLGQSPLGLYSVGMHLASLPAQRVSQVVNQMAFPAFSRQSASVAISVIIYCSRFVRSASSRFRSSGASAALLERSSTYFSAQSGWERSRRWPCWR